MAEKMKISERAKQFMPFSALKGFDDMIEVENKEPSDRKILSEEDSDNIGQVLGEIKKNDVVKITFYETDGYVTLTGIVAKLDYDMKRLTVIKRVIDFEDIYFIEKVSSFTG